MPERSTQPRRDLTGEVAPWLLTIAEAEERTGLSRRYLTDAIRQGRLRVARFGRAVRVDAHDLAAFVEAAKP